MIRTSLLTLLAHMIFSQLVAQNKIEPIVQFGHGTRIITEIVFSPDASMLATTDGAILKLWDMSSGLEFRAFTIEAPSAFERITHLDFTPDNNGIIYSAGSEIIYRNIIDGTIQKKATIEQELPVLEEGQEEYNEEQLKAYRDIEMYKGVVFSPDKSLIAETTNKRIQIKDFRNQNILTTIKLPIKQKNDSTIDFLLSMNPIKSFAFSADNQTILHEGQLYDIRDSTLKFDFLKGKKDFLQTCGAISPEGNVVAIGGMIIEESKEEEEDDNWSFVKALAGDKEGDVLFLFDAQTGDLLKKVQSKGIFGLEFSKDGKKLLIGQSGSLIKLWDWKNDQTILSLKTRKTKYADAENWIMKLMNLNPISAVIFTADGKGVLSSGDSNLGESLIIWDINTGEKIRSLGANIPPIKLEGQSSNTDSLILREFKELQQSIFIPNPPRLFQGYRILNLTNANVPQAFAKNDSIIFSPLGNRYLFRVEGELLEVYDADINFHLSTLEKSKGFKHLVFNPTGELVTGALGNTFKVWEAKTGKILWQSIKHKDPIDELVFSQNGQVLSSISKEEGLTFFWDINRQKVIYKQNEFFVKELNKVKKGTKKLAGKLRNFSKNLGDTKLFNRQGQQSEQHANTLEKVSEIAGILNTKGHYDVSFSLDGKRAAIWMDNLYSIKFIDLESGNLIRRVIDPNLMLMQKFMFRSMDEEDMEQEKAIEEDSMVNEILPKNYMELIMQDFKNQYNLKNLSAISPDFKVWARATKKISSDEENAITIYTIAKKKKEQSWSLEESAAFQEGLTFSWDGKLIAASNQAENEIRIWEVSTGKVLKTLRGHSGKITFGPKGKTLISSGWDRQVKVWDIDKNEQIYTFIGIKGSNDYIIILPNGYYTTSRKESKAVAFRKGKKAYPFEQFDLQFNRPDKLLNTIGEEMLSSLNINPNKELATAYKNAYLKRLEKLNFTEDMFNKDISLPFVEVSNLPLSSSSKNIQLSLKASDNNYQLAALNIWVNDVPIFGKTGKNLRSQPRKNYAETINLELSNGENKIQVSVYNTKGVESLKSTYNVTYTGSPTTADLHLVTFGVSNFKNEDMNLDYPVKDVQDVGRLFELQKPNEYRTLHQHSLTDEQFTLERIAALEKTLSKTKVDDKVIIYIATHGLLDEDWNYYLATHGTDFDNPKLSALPYARLESMLDKIPARNKVVFIDACHAGEVDDTDLAELKSPVPEMDIKFRKFRSSNWNKLGMQNSFDLMKSLFVDLRRGTGATIISSASGVELAMDGSAEWDDNSVFTYSFLKGLKDQQADLNFDGEITISELQQYLPKMVSRLTNNLQRPTYRMENIGNDWRVW